MELLKQYITTLWPQWQWDSFLSCVSAASNGFPLDPIPDVARTPLGFRHPLKVEPFSPYGGSALLPGTDSAYP